MLATGYDDGTVDLWDIEEKRKVASLKTHQGEVRAIGFNNTHNQMATSGTDRILKLWDMNDLEALPVTFGDVNSIVVAIGFSPDGQVVVSGYYDGDVNIVTRPATAELMTREMCSSLSRNMTREEWSAYVGRDIGYEATCPEKELSIKVKEIR
jgi:WD40 repeat protein